jgi:hypothetical protein
MKVQHWWDEEEDVREDEYEDLPAPPAQDCISSTEGPAGY